MKCLKEKGVSVFLFSRDRGSNYSCTSAMQGLERYARENNAFVMSCFCGVGCGKCNCDALGAVVHNDYFNVNVSMKKEKKKEGAILFVSNALQAALFKVEEDRYYALKNVTPIYSTVSREEYDAARRDHPDLLSVLMWSLTRRRSSNPLMITCRTSSTRPSEGSPGA